MRTHLPNIAQTGALVIEKVKISTNMRNSRGRLPKVLYGFQKLYSQSVLRDKVLHLLEETLPTGNPKAGRPGMCLWQILVLSVVRTAMGYSYADLLDLVNNHAALRGILGLGGLSQEFTEQTLHDNIRLVTEEVLVSINLLLLELGNTLLKKSLRLP